MTIPPSTEGSLAPAPFAVTAPPHLELDVQRTGSTSFVVTNLTGRPVRARFVPRGRSGADDGWLRVVGPPELALAVGATATVAVAVTVPPGAAPGPYTLLLEVVPEDDTEAVVGQSVAFTVPAIATTPRRIPWWIFLIIGLLVLVVGAVVVLLLTRGSEPPPPAVPSAASRPTIAGTAEIGQTLTASPGEWSSVDALTQQWQRCASTDDCVDLAGATELTYRVVSADLDTRLRVVVTGRGPGGQVSAVSDLTAPVHARLVQVPAFIGRSITEVRRLAESSGLDLSIRTIPDLCRNGVVRQSPEAGTEVPEGSVVTLVVAIRTGKFCGGR